MIQRRDASASTSSARPATGRLDTVLNDHHRRIGELANKLLADAIAGHTDDLVNRWCDLELEVDNHMAEEEAIILPAYASHAPLDAVAVLAEHTQLRKLLDPVGIASELPETLVRRLRLIVSLLEIHAQHEDHGMYAWAEPNIEATRRGLLLTRIPAWFES